MVSNQVAFSSTLVSGNRLSMQARSGSVVIDTVCLSVKSDTVATDNKSAMCVIWILIVRMNLYKRCMRKCTQNNRKCVPQSEF